MKRDPKHPRLTPLRALDLFEAMALDRHDATDEVRRTWDRVTNALRDHVRAELTSKRRTRKAGAK